MNNIKVDYKKNWGNDGTCYTQTITIDKDFKELYNNYLLELKIKIDKNYIENKSYSDYDLKIKSLNYLENGINYTNLIHLNTLLNLINVINDNDLFINKIDFKRILWRNSIIKVEV